MLMSDDLPTTLIPLDVDVNIAIVCSMHQTQYFNGKFKMKKFPGIEFYCYTRARTFKQQILQQQQQDW
jgi:hypothetical protein